MCPQLVPTAYNFEEIKKVALQFYDLAVARFGVLSAGVSLAHFPFFFRHDKFPEIDHDQ